MPINPNEPLSVLERATYGTDARRHAVTGMLLEQGSGALSPKLQAYRVHLPIIARTEGKAAAERMLAKLDAYYALVDDPPPPPPPAPVEKAQQIIARPPGLAELSDVMRIQAERR